MSKTIGCAIAAVVGLVLLGVAFFGFKVVLTNRMIELDEGVESAWAQVENVYQRREDLIPNLVATVKGAADFETDTFTAVTEARAKVGQTNITGAPNAEQMAAFESAQGELSSALSRLLLVVERYPDLKATANFADLQSQLEGTENRIAVERKRFNEVARAYNTTRRKFPYSMFVKDFDARPYFQAVEGADQAPRVDFG